MAEEPERKDVMQEIFAKSLRNEKFRCLACFDDFLLFDTITCSKCYQQTCHHCFECLDDRQYAHVPTKNKLCPGCRHVLVTVQMNPPTCDTSDTPAIVQYDNFMETADQLWSTDNEVDYNTMLIRAASNGHSSVCEFLKDWGIQTRHPSSAQQQ